MNSKNISSYTWDDTITIQLSNGLDFKIKLADHKNAEYIGFTCSSCGEGTTLANGECGQCSSPFEPKDLAVAKSIGGDPDNKVKVESLDRLIFLLTHRSWMCKQCDSFNMNYPREKSTGNHSCDCINCGKGFIEGESILFEDGYSEYDIVAATSDYSQRINDAVKQDSYENSRNTDSNYQEIRRSHSVAKTAHGKNKFKIIVGALGGGSLLLYALHYGFIEKIDYDFEIKSHSSLRTIGIDKHLPKTGEDWERNISSLDYDNFQITDEYQKEDRSDSYQVQNGFKTVEDRSNCTAYDNPVQQCTVIPRKCDYAVVNGVKVEGNCTAASKSCHTPDRSCIDYGEKEVPNMETRYKNHPYIEYSYNKWEEVDRIGEPISGKNPRWPNMDKYDFTPNSILEGTRRESYSVIVTYGDGKKEVNLDENTWNSLGKGDGCTVQSTRVKGITSDTLRKLDKLCELQ